MFFLDMATAPRNPAALGPPVQDLGVHGVGVGRNAPHTGRFPMMQWVTSYLGTWAALTGPNFFFFFFKDRVG